MQDINIRRARQGDGLHVFQVTKQSIEELSNGLYTSEQLDGWMGQRTPDFYEQLIQNNKMVVAILGDKIVGFVDAEPGEVTRLFLLHEASGKGLGARLLKIGIDNATEPDMRVIKVESTLNAVGFYEHHGFTAISSGVFSHGIGGQPIDIVHMELVLEP